MRSDQQNEISITPLLGHGTYGITMGFNHYLEATGSGKECREIGGASVGGDSDALGLQELKRLSNVQDRLHSCTHHCHWGSSELGQVSTGIQA